MCSLAKKMLDFLRTWGAAIWIVTILVFVVVGLINQPLSFQELAARVDLKDILIALCLILFGKFMTILLVNNVLIAHGERRGLRFALHAYSLSDVAKYLPGGIWGITGRVYIFKRSGIGLWVSGQILLKETLILVAFSFLSGATAVLLSRMDIRLAGLGLVLAATMVAVLLRVVLPRVTPRLSVWTFLQQTAAWICFGASFSFVVAPNMDSFLPLAGIFNLGFAVGTAAVFAPSGLGARELVIAWLGGDAAGVSPRVLIELTLVHRFVWIAADFLTLIPAMALGSGEVSRPAELSRDAET